ncbi:hypothetical protein M5K25_000491 [Dendrobium thyrsiflorum]|uniref:Uncharacterized protein n=1 Tax=Dendrobium thyrsiflorum TaxID=117978 RepID=A0ABD0VU34_DENTH
MASIIFWNCRGARKKQASLYLKRDFSNQVVIGDLEVVNRGVWRIATVYGGKEAIQRSLLWDKIEDKSGGNAFWFSQASKEMKSFLLNNDLHERLDRCFVNTAALNSAHLVLRHLARVTSDHCPISLNLVENNFSCDKIIRFEDVWASYPASVGIVRTAWNKKTGGNFQEVLNCKFRRTLRSLFFWSKAKHKEFKKQKEDLKRCILDLQLKEAEVGWLFEEDSLQLRACVGELNSVLARLNTW